MPEIDAVRDESQVAQHGSRQRLQDQRPIVRPEHDRQDERNTDQEVDRLAGQLETRAGEEQAPLEPELGRHEPEEHHSARIPEPHAAGDVRHVVPDKPAMIGPRRHDRQRHAGGEHIEVGRDPQPGCVAPRVVRIRRHLGSEKPEHHAAERKRNTDAEEALSLSIDRAPLAEPTSGRRNPRQHEIEAQLSRKAPRLRESRNRSTRVVHVHEPKRRKEANDAEDRHNTERELDHQSDPVARVDAHQSTDPERTRRRSGPTFELGRHERPIQQEAREHEEDGDADVHAG